MTVTVPTDETENRQTTSLREGPGQLMTLPSTYFLLCLPWGSSSFHYPSLPSCDYFYYTDGKVLGPFIGFVRLSSRVERRGTPRRDLWSVSISLPS